ncbi:MAG TPA: hypothetical protein PKI68_01135 [Pontiellaceae bacterium]|nr:hypothetical protein [Pontiellaceae bacterium]
MSLNMAAFGKELGVSRATVSLWKKDGMPTCDRDAAISWLAGKHPHYVEKLAGEIVGAGAGNAPRGAGGSVEGLDLPSTLARFREIEFRAWQDLDSALLKRKEADAGSAKARDLDAAISRLSKRYKDSAEDRLGMEKRVADFELETGRRVGMDRVNEFINDKFAGLVVLIKALPYTESRNVNPNDPETAKRELGRWVNNLLRQQREEMAEND